MIQYIAYNIICSNAKQTKASDAVLVVHVTMLRLTASNSSNSISHILSTW